MQAAEHVLVEGFADALGVKIAVDQLDGAIAQLVVVHGQAIILLSDRLTDPAERRFNIAHELGHFLLKHPSPPIEELCAPTPHDHRSEERDHEGEADAFASELLMPEFVTHKVCEQQPLTLQSAAELAQLCSVTVVASAIRIAERTDQVCAVVLSEHRVIRWAVPSRSFRSAFPTSLAPGSQLAPASLAHRVHDGSTSHDRPDLVPRAAWLAPVDAHYHGTILEHSVATGGPGAVVTMLWMIWGPRAERLPLDGI